MLRKPAARETKEAVRPSALNKKAHVCLRATAVMATSFLSGSMASISAVNVPVLLDTGVHSTQILSQWSRLYYYGHIYMPSLAVATTGVFLYLALQQRQRHFQLMYAVAGVMTVGIVPFTLLLMSSTNETLFNIEKLASVSQVGAGAQAQAAVELIPVRELVRRWAWLHALRSVFPLIGSIIGMKTLVEELGQPH